MSGSYSINLTNQQESFSGGVSLIPSITLCAPGHLEIQSRSQTSTGNFENNYVFDRETGKAIVIQHPSFALMMTDSSLSFRTNWNCLPRNRLIALLKCLLILQSLPEAALGEAFEELKKVDDFYFDRSSQVNLPIISSIKIKGKLEPAQVRPPIVLEP